MSYTKLWDLMVVSKFSPLKLFMSVDFVNLVEYLEQILLFKRERPND